VFSEVLSSLFFGITTDFTDHHNTLGLGIVEEDLEAIDEVGAVEGITADTDAKSLAESGLSCLVDGFVSQSTRSGDNTDLSSLMDVAGHDTDLALLRRDDTGAVGADESGLVLLDESRLDTDHILGGDTFSNANGKRNFGFDGVKDSVRGEFWGNVDHGSVGASSLRKWWISSTERLPFEHQQRS